MDFMGNCHISVNFVILNNFHVVALIMRRLFHLVSPVICGLVLSVHSDNRVLGLWWLLKYFCPCFMMVERVNSSLKKFSQCAAHPQTTKLLSFNECHIQSTFLALSVTMPLTLQPDLSLATRTECWHSSLQLSDDFDIMPVAFT